MKKRDKLWQEKFVPAPASNRRNSNTLFLLTGQGSECDRHAQRGKEGIKETFPEHCKPSAQMYKTNCETKRVKGLCK
jgi:hypothetical protein